jgi:thiamine pyrophosphate-dependent acetolactate synthase large subunit-like protein
VQARKLGERVVLFTGDGGFHFQLNELAHFQRQRLPLTIVCLRNDTFQLGRLGRGTVYECSDPAFSLGSLIRAYGGQARRCATAGDFRDYYRACLRSNSGLRLIEVPCARDEKHQCREVRLLNLYIRARNGDPRAIARWGKVCNPG